MLSDRVELSSAEARVEDIKKITHPYHTVESGGFVDSKL